MKSGAIVSIPGRCGETSALQPIASPQLLETESITATSSDPVSEATSSLLEGIESEQIATSTAANQ
jgi:hypothetical protein